jgi:chromosome partitioning protein
VARWIAIGMQKGGVGKTTLTTNLAAAMAGGLGLNVLVLDFDGQRNATLGLLGQRPDGGTTIESVLRETVPLPQAAVPTEFTSQGQLHVVPGTRGLTAWEREIRDWNSTMLRFREVLRNGFPSPSPSPSPSLSASPNHSDGDYDIVLIDTPPAGGLWLQAALTAADGYIIVTQCERYGAEGVQLIQETARRIRHDARLNPDLVLDGFVVNGLKSRRANPRTFLAAYRAAFAESFLEPPIPDLSGISDAATTGVPVEFAARWSKEAKVFRQLADALNDRLTLGGVNTVDLVPADNSQETADG